MPGAMVERACHPIAGLFELRRRLVEGQARCKLDRPLALCGTLSGVLPSRLVKCVQRAVAKHHTRSNPVRPTLLPWETLNPGYAAPGVTCRRVRPHGTAPLSLHWEPVARRTGELPPHPHTLPPPNRSISPPLPPHTTGNLNDTRPRPRATHPKSNPYLWRPTCDEPHTTLATCVTARFRRPPTPTWGRS
eukprot:365825-Chlamydomonas_euryale.AAC.10